MRREIEMTSTDLRLPATELSKLEPARSPRAHHVEPDVEPPAPVRRRVRRAVRTVVGYARA
jgi:hypothetical protein